MKKIHIFLLGFFILSVTALHSDEINNLEIRYKQIGSPVSAKIIEWQRGAGLTTRRIGPLLRQSTLTISVKASGGKWLGVSFKDSAGKVFHVPANKAKLLRGYGDFEWKVPNKAKGKLYVTVVLWRDYNRDQDKMVGELDRIHWFLIGEKVIDLP
jgi:hypothetical protein